MTNLNMPSTLKRPSFAPPTTSSHRHFYNEAQHPEISIHSPENTPGADDISPHTLRVKMLYLKLLRDYQSYYGFERDLMVQKIGELRNIFEEHRHEKDYGTVNTLIKHAEVFLYERGSPDPYTPLTNKNGGLYGRNRPLEREFLAPDPSIYVYGVDYGEEERTIRHLHDLEKNPLPTESTGSNEDPFAFYYTKQSPDDEYVDIHGNTPSKSDV